MDDEEATRQEDLSISERQNYLDKVKIRNDKIRELTGTAPAVQIDPGELLKPGQLSTTVELARRFEDCGVAAIVYTDIARDGALSGIDSDAIATLARQVRIPVIASGGVSSLDDIAALKAHQRDGIAGVICGRALYDGRVDPGAALRLVAETPSC